jgi:hypothetical protein
LEWTDFPGHTIVLETPRLILRPFRESDFVVALPFYADAELRQAMEVACWPASCRSIVTASCGRAG